MKISFQRTIQNDICFEYAFVFTKTCSSQQCLATYLPDLSINKRKQKAK